MLLVASSPILLEARPLSCSAPPQSPKATVLLPWPTRRIIPDGVIIPWSGSLAYRRQISGQALEAYRRG
jgi:hypothetical protein